MWLVVRTSRDTLGEYSVNLLVQISPVVTPMSAYEANPNNPVTMASLHAADQALKLWLDFFLDVGDPFVPSEIDGDLSCFFCGSYSAVSRELVEHEKDCIFVRARDLMLKNEYVVTAKNH